MKKYVSAILIDALFMQLCGCYTLRDYTYDEFRDMKDVTKASIIYDTDREINLNKEALNYYYRNWVAEADTLRIYSNYSEDSPLDTLILYKSQIKTVQINEFDEIKLAFSVAFFVGLVFILVKNIKFNAPLYD